MNGVLKTGLTMATAGLAGVVALLTPQHAAACGGLFCNSSQAQVVNQAAERIIFSENGDGTVTAVIEVMYEGSADKFAWLLPVPGDPKVAVSSAQVFNQLQSLTDPSYTVTQQLEGTCMQPVFAPQAGGFANQSPSAPTDAGSVDPTGDTAAPPPVVVISSGIVGPYDYSTIAVMEGLDDRADVAVEWLGDNGYDVGALGPDVLRPYLDEGLNLLAFKLTKGNTTGSIRPVSITYEADLPAIPIRPTAVAANDNMGVMVFMLGSGRAIPKNYKALELNEAALDWFNPAQVYNTVINRAADESGGQGFVTEFAGSTSFLENAIFNDSQRNQWNNFQSGSFGTGLDMLRSAFNLYGSWDGFDQALKAGVTPDDPDLIQTALNCFNCPMTSEVTVDAPAFVEGLYENVIEPVLDSHNLLLSAATITRLYTTMSADEMTVDPLFDNNNDLADVSNLHTATQFIECNPNVLRQDAPWRIELPQGDVVRGAGSGRVWPLDVMEQPANLRIMQLSTSGQGEVVMDNRAMITEMLIEQGKSFAVGEVSGNGGPGNPGSGVTNPGGTPGSNGPSTNLGEDNGGSSSSGALCSAAPGFGSGGALPYFALALVAMAIRRRRGARA